MRVPLDKYYAVPQYNTQEAAIKAGLKPPPFNADLPIKTWVLPESAANGATQYRYDGVVRSQDLKSAAVEAQFVGRRTLPILNVPPGQALGGDDRIDVSYSLPVPIKPLPPEAKLVIVFGGNVMVEIPDTEEDAKEPVSFTRAHSEQLQRIEAGTQEIIGLIKQAVGK